MGFQLEPSSNCRRCPRLVSLRRECHAAEPDWHNAPVEGYGSLDAWLLVIGLAPGRRGANRTGRPFTGDAAGGYLFDMLGRFDLASGTYQDDGDDDIRLHGTRITMIMVLAPRLRVSIVGIGTKGIEGRHRIVAKGLITGTHTPDLLLPRWSVAAIRRNCSREGYNKNP